MKVIIDRFEGDFVVVETEDRKLVNLPKSLLPTGAGEGSVLSIELDKGETKGRKARIEKLMGDVWKD